MSLSTATDHDGTPIHVGDTVTFRSPSLFFALIVNPPRRPRKRVTYTGKVVDIFLDVMGKPTLEVATGNDATHCVRAIATRVVT